MFKKLDNVYNLLCKQIAKKPDSIAIVTRNKNFTYNELEYLIELTVFKLLNLGVKENDKVLLLTNRSIEYVISVFALLKIGAIFIPADPKHPIERYINLGNIDYVISNVDHDWETEIPLIYITYNDLLSQILITTYTSKHSNNLDSSGYVMLTSGTTGKPKGIFINQNNLNYYVHALIQRLSIDENTVYLHLASISFSSSVRQLLLPLLAGGRLVIADEIHREDFTELINLILNFNITLLDITPSHLTALLSSIEELPTLKINIKKHTINKILTASEPLNKNIIKLINIIFGDKIKLINMYGQTEASGIVSTFEIDSINKIDGDVVPLGIPLDNIEIAIFNEDLLLLQGNDIGEICVSSPTLSQKYLGVDISLVEDFFHTTIEGVQKRFFRTGDIGMKSPEGDINFLGRKSHFVKLRGLRISLEEIKNILLENPNVRNAIVFTVNKVEEDSIVACIVLSKECSEYEIRLYLKQRIPDYMVPTKYIFINKIPLTGNFKVDYNSIIELLDSEESLRLTQSSLLEMSPIEYSIFKIWQQVFKNKEIRDSDDFYTLGGHSLSAARIAASINNHFKIDIKLTDIFEYNTIYMLAGFVEKKLNSLKSS